MSLSVRIAHAFTDFELDVAFRAPVAGVTALFGPSGAGKSTVINAIAGLLQPRSGDIRLGDEVLLDTARGVALPPHRRRLGVVFQDARLFPHLSVLGNCLYGARRAPVPPTQARIDEVFALLDLVPLLQRTPATLSGGERQRVAIARALLAVPRMLLLDEPLAGLDHARKREVLPYLERLHESAGLPMILVSHAVDEVAQLADEVVMIERGKVRGHGAARELLARTELFPAGGEFAAATVLDAIVRGPVGDDLTCVAFDGGELLLPRVERAPGAALRVRVRADDVMLALTEPDGISANNVLAATIEAFDETDGACVSVRLRCGNVTLLSRITRHSQRRLALREGATLFAIVKSVSLA